MGNKPNKSFNMVIRPKRSLSPEHPEEEPRDPKRQKVQDPAEENINTVRNESNESQQERFEDTNMEGVDDSEEYADTLSRSGKGDSPQKQFDDQSMEDSDSEDETDSLRQSGENDNPTQAPMPHESDEGEEAEEEHGELILSGWTPVNPGRRRSATKHSDSTGETPRQALPQAPEGSSPAPLFTNWLSPKISAAEIRRQCSSRNPPIRIPTRMLAKEVKSKYGLMLMELDKENADPPFEAKNEEEEEEILDVEEPDVETAPVEAQDDDEENDVENSDVEMAEESEESEDE